MNCSIEGCSNSRHIARTGLQHATMCDAHDAMLHVLQGELMMRSGKSEGATGLLRATQASPDGLDILESEFQRRYGSNVGAAALLARMDAARNRAMVRPFSTRRSTRTGDYNLIFKYQSGNKSDAQILAFGLETMFG